MKLKSMKLSQEDQMKHSQPTAVCDRPEFPYGLEIRLEEESLEKLGITELPEVGETMMISAKVRVCNTSKHDSERGSHRSLGLQITDLGLGAAAEEKADPSKTLYGEK